MLDWVEIGRVCGLHHSVNILTNQEISNNFPDVWAGVIVHENKAILTAAVCGATCGQNFVNISNGIQISGNSICTSCVLLVKLCHRKP